MDPDRATKILERQRDLAAALAAKRTPDDFTKWQRDTEVAIERIFGDQSRHLNEFKDIRFSLSVWISGMPDSAFTEAQTGGLRTAVVVLQSMIDEIEEYDRNDGEVSPAPDTLNLIERICLRFHAVARQLQARHANRPTIAMDDEYDVQDLLHALLRMHFDDVRVEEASPSYAGRSSRLDFLLKEEQIVVEVKRTRKSLTAAQLGEELIVDIARYEHHPDCKTLVCFVYDPEGRVGNPAGIERDLERQSSPLRVRVIIAPKA
ncbi:MAG: hypothetical protein Q8S03_04895 [Brevundimonas sp.]|uniref:PD-(D/E)XK nuclease domain-containing protein n=1 Tax=Brevundimonas sp. TaxID=1871086 RepID=UPI00273325C6|nr:hypothetical protein [Brevundimonas sp.]MDP3404007.1 hypothetical protein [Brevundimonas sp.]